MNHVLQVNTLLLITLPIPSVWNVQRENILLKIILQCVITLTPIILFQSQDQLLKQVALPIHPLRVEAYRSQTAFVTLVTRELGIIVMNYFTAVHQLLIVEFMQPQVVHFIVLSSAILQTIMGINAEGDVILLLDGQHPLQPVPTSRMDIKRFCGIDLGTVMDLGGTTALVMALRRPLSVMTRKLYN